MRPLEDTTFIKNAHASRYVQRRGANSTNITKVVHEQRVKVSIGQYALQPQDVYYADGHIAPYIVNPFNLFQGSVVLDLVGNGIYIKE